MKSPTYQIHKPLSRIFGLSKLKLLSIFLILSTIILLTSYAWHDLRVLTVGGEDLASPGSDTNEQSNKTKNPKDPDYWTWNTITRFQIYKSASKSTPPLTKTSDDLCHDFPTESLSRVQIVLKTGITESSERVDASMNGVTRCVTNLLVVSDRATELHGHRVHDVLADLAPFAEQINSTDYKLYLDMQRGDTTFDGAKGWMLDRFKFLPMIERAKAVNPTAEWFVFIETDTYFFWDNLFRLLDQFDPSVPLYFGSPSPGFGLEDGKRVWFGYGGSGFVLSKAAVDKLTARKIGSYGEYLDPSLSERYMEVVDRDCCGDSVLGFALYQSGVRLSGMWPMFNAHPLHGIPFGGDQWCQPVISLHKSLFSDMLGLAKWESQRDKTDPVLYSDLSDYLQLGDLTEKEDWDNGDWGGIEQHDTPAQESLDACRQACHDDDSCLSYTWVSEGKCIFMHTIRLGGKKIISSNKLTAGWNNAGILKWRASHRCEAPKWMKPSITRIF
ncbi:hypothetical protein N7478_003595 [Penicillium angulare]|uniref:uncharacterized protein n=1 Tax=Penicillium angulare TaxID=116970 RepID=UPI00253FD8BE|nr:uncharacterized protein N7478_003595 [Penicillium angulare]KAJ5287909.1 hypothetical protein N7478_003595 [Penicillium angulare]